jgi:hypothetical protein
MKIVFETEYEKLCFERLLENVYATSALLRKNVYDELADSLASLFVKVSKADTSVKESDYTESTATTGSLALPALPYFGKNPDV